MCCANAGCVLCHVWATYIMKVASKQDKQAYALPSDVTCSAVNVNEAVHGHHLRQHKASCWRLEQNQSTS